MSAWKTHHEIDTSDDVALVHAAKLLPRLNRPLVAKTLQCGECRNSYRNRFRGCTLRQQEPRVLTVEDFHQLLSNIQDEPFRTMLLIDVCRKTNALANGS